MIPHNVKTIFLKNKDFSVHPELKTIFLNVEIANNLKFRRNKTYTISENSGTAAGKD